MKGNYFKMQIVKIGVQDKRYPQRLLGIKNFPTDIYAIGKIELLNTMHTVGIVGARKCTEYGRMVTSEFAKELSAKEICIVSGMAMGIDGIAHNIAIGEKGKTIAVLGCGFNYIYPPENEWLFYKIIQNGGCVITEYPPETEPDNKKIPKRNRIISGLSDAVLVVEARYRSGSTITAKYAKEEGKKIYAIPNNIYVETSGGTNILIQEGATLVINPLQIVNEVKSRMEEKGKQNNTIIAEHVEKLVNDQKIGKYKKESSRQYYKSIKSRKMAIDKIIKMEEKNEEGEEKNARKRKEEVRLEKDSNVEKNDEVLILQKEYIEIYKLLSDEPIHINEIAQKIHKTINEVIPTITMMELEGYAYQPQINYFVRKE